LVNLLLFGLFLFQFQIDRISGSLSFNTSTLSFAGIFTCISILFFIENLLRHLKPERRYAYKHLLFLLLLLAVIYLLYFYRRVSYGDDGQILLYLILMVQLPLPPLVGVSAARMAGLEGADFQPGRGGQVQYFMVLIGAGLLIAGITQMLDFYFSEVRSSFYHALLLVLLLFLGGLLLLSDLFRRELNQWMRSYFLGDSTDYRKEWTRSPASLVRRRASSSGFSTTCFPASRLARAPCT
jgi:hypothetical protein